MSESLSSTYPIRKRNSSPMTQSMRRKTLTKDPVASFWQERERPDLTADSVEVERLRTIIKGYNKKLCVRIDGCKALLGGHGYEARLRGSPRPVQEV